MNRNLLIILTALVMLCSCKKDQGETKDNQACKITSFTPVGEQREYTKSPYTIAYNTDGRISTITNLNDLRRYSYEANKLLISKGDLLLTYNYNSLNQIATVTNNKAQENVIVTYTSNKITKILTSIDNISSTFTYNANNEVIKIDERWGNNPYLDVTITYKDEKYSNSLLFELIFPRMIDGEIRHFIKYNLAENFGGTEKRLIDKVVYKYYQNNEYTEAYSYLRDEKGNIVQIIINSGANRSFNLTYTCN